MAEVLTFAEIQARYVGEWILVEDPQTDLRNTVVSGQVLAHSKERDEVYRQAIALHPKRFAVLYTGSIPSGAAVVL